MAAKLDLFRPGTYIADVRLCAMLLSGALFVLFMTGFWLYCLTDAILTPAPQCRGLPKRAWIAIIMVTFIGGAIAWLIVRRPVHGPSSPPLSPMAGQDSDASDDD